MAHSLAADETGAQPLRRRAGPLRIIGRILLGVVLVLFVAWLVLYITKGRFLKHPFESIASRTLQRQVSVGGDFNLYFDPLNLHFRAEDMAIANPRWARDRRFFAARRIDARIATVPLLFGRRVIRTLDLANATVAPEWDARHRHNTWTFGDPERKGEPMQLPRIRRGIVVGTRIAYRDPQMQLAADIAVDTIRAQDTRFADEIRFHGDGAMRRQPFTLSGRLMSPNETVSGGRNVLALHVDAGHSILDADGTLPGATELAGSEFRVRAHGANLALLFDFIGIAVPPTRSYRLTSSVTYDGIWWKATRLAGTFGDSDLAGSLAVSAPDNRMRLTADLRTRGLDIVDAGPFIGYDPQRLDKLGAKGAVRQEGGHPRVLPDAPLRSAELANFDADVRYRVGAIKGRNVPVSQIDLTLLLDHSLLKLAPVTALVAGGRLRADVSVDARRPQVFTDYDIRLSPTPMGKLLARFGVAESGTTGTLSARIHLAGTGDSLRRSLATSNGRMAFIIPAGTMWTRNIQLAELDVGTFIQKMFEKKLKEPVQINCGLIGFTVRNGVAAADPILIDTKKNVILGRGGFSFASEALDLSLRADAKTFSLFSGQSPVAVNGYFAAPGINPISPQLLARAGIAVGGGLALSPFAALLAFIDPGDAKAAACGPVLAGAHARAMRTDKGKPRDDVGNGGTGKSESGKRSPQERREQARTFRRR
ncbi:MAG: AsmA family protein [Sphingomonadales bacterium]|nr:AsmA family protein [Sphingomonadales bacterium]